MLQADHFTICLSPQQKPLCIPTELRRHPIDSENRALLVPTVIGEVLPLFWLLPIEVSWELWEPVQSLGILAVIPSTDQPLKEASGIHCVMPSTTPVGVMCNLTISTIES